MTFFLLMLVGHALADYPLQGDFLARAKNHTAPIPGVPWVHGLFWHAVIHGGAVGLATGSAVLGVAETLVHMLIDHAKCAGWFNRWFGAVPWGERLEQPSTDDLSRAFHIDQGLHVACKVLWALAATLWSLP